MNKILFSLIKVFLILVFFNFNTYSTYGEEEENKSILQQLKIYAIKYLALIQTILRIKC